MKVLLTGATGFVGTGVLAEALASNEVSEVVLLGRSSPEMTHDKLRAVCVEDLADLSAVEQELQGFDACFWCLGTSSAGMDEGTYTRITHTFTMEAARVLGAYSPGVIFCFLSGSGADGGAMWARVKKRAETDLQSAGLGGVVVFRPAFIQDRHGAKMRGLAYKSMYAVASLFSPLIRGLGGGTSNADIGRAMIVSAREKADGLILDSAETNRVAARF